MILIEHTQPASHWRNWLRAALVTAVGIVVVVLAFFFLAVVVVTGAIAAAAIGLRWWWLTRRLRERSRHPAVFEGEYQIIERRKTRPEE